MKPSPPWGFSNRSGSAESRACTVTSSPCFGESGPAGGARAGAGAGSRHCGSRHAYGDAGGDALFGGHHAAAHADYCPPSAAPVWLSGQVRALHAIDLPVLALEDGSGLAQEKVRARCIQALKEDGCGAIVLGCGGMATLAHELTRELRVPVIDGVSAAVKMVESLVALGLSTSKHGDLAFPEKKALSGYFQALNPF